MYGPREAVPRQPPEIPIPQLQSPSEEVARELEAGEIGVVGMTGVIGVRPKAIDTADDVRIESLKWSSWGADGAVGEGEMRAPRVPADVRQRPQRASIAGDGHAVAASGSAAAGATSRAPRSA